MLTDWKDVTWKVKYLHATFQSHFPEVTLITVFASNSTEFLHIYKYIGDPDVGCLPYPYDWILFWSHAMLETKLSPCQGAFTKQSYQIYLMNKVLKVDGVGEKGHIAGGWHLFLKHNYVYYASPS